MTLFLERSHYYHLAARGRLSGIKTVGKFGAAPSGIQTTPTDIWDRANAAATQSIWLAPTSPRVHTIQSTSVQDTTGGTGVDTIRVSYLPDWDTKEVTVTLTGDINAGIVMDEAAVIIHRMQCIAQASTTNVGLNEGTITATAAVDGTITAAILPSNGQTEMAIYGVPSSQYIEIVRWNVQIDRASQVTATADFTLRLNTNPDVQTVAFTRKDDISLQSTGTNAQERNYAVPKIFSGPCIIKIQGISSANDLDGESGFDALIVDK